MRIHANMFTLLEGTLSVFSVTRNWTSHFHCNGPETTPIYMEYALQASAQAKKKTQHMRTPSIKILTSGVSPITRLHCNGLDSQNLVNKQPQTKINWQWKLLVLFQDHTP